MSNFRHLSAVDQAEKAIGEAISAGKWRGALPSYRQLSEWMGLSCPTIALAVTRLAKRGLLVSPGKRQRYRIASKSGRRGAAKPRRHLLAVFPQADGVTDQEQRRLIIEAIRRASKDGWECTETGLDYIDARSVQRRWDQLLEHRPTHLLAAPGTQHLATWASRHGLETAFIGGQAAQPEQAVSIGVRIAEVLAHGVGELRRRGHRRILMPSWSGMPGIAKVSSRILAEVCQTRQDRLLAEGWVQQWQPGTAREQRRQLAETMERLRPTAIICSLSRDYLLATQCAQAAGLEVPRDLSLITLSPSPDMDWMLPAPAYYKVDLSLLIDAVDRWRHGKPVTHEAMTRAVVAAWNPGETVGPAPAEA